MKLLYVENSLAIHGGVERVLTDKLNWLVEEGNCEVCLIIANQGENPIVFPLNPKVQCHDMGIMFHQVYRYKGWRRYCLMFQLHLLFRRSLAEEIRLFAPDAIICTRLELVYDVIKVRGDIPVVFEAHNSYIDFHYYRCFQRFQIKFFYHVLRKVNLIVALTQGDALEWKKINPHVHVIPNVVHLNDTDRYSDCSSKSAIFVGRYSQQKDIPSLLKIWELVSHQYPDWQLHIFGGYGGQENRLQSAINQHGANVVVHQPTTSINEEYLKCSMLLMTSRYEPFGLVIPEAMSCGLPVVAFDCPYGPANIITDGVDGFLIRERDIKYYANKVCQLIADQNLRNKMGKAGVLSSQRFKASNIMPQWIQLFNQLSKH